MSGLTFEQLRVPLAIVLLVAAVIVLWPRGNDERAGDLVTPQPSVEVGRPGGEVVSTDTPPPTAAPAETPAATAEATQTPTPQPVANGFSAEVLACQSISGSSCNGQLGTLPAGAGSFTALVRFTDATAGDTMNAILTGPSGTIPGAAYTLQGSGDGYYYTTFIASGLAPGDYTLTATRNGTEVATTSFTRG